MDFNTTVIPQFTRLPWQAKNCVNQNSRHTNHSIDKKIVKNFFIKLKFNTIKPCYTNFFEQGLKTS